MSTNTDLARVYEFISLVTSAAESLLDEVATIQAQIDFEKESGDVPTL